MHKHYIAILAIAALWLALPGKASADLCWPGPAPGSWFCIRTGSGFGGQPGGPSRGSGLGPGARPAGAYGGFGCQFSSTGGFGCGGSGSIDAGDLFRGIRNVIVGNTPSRGLNAVFNAPGVTPFGYPTDTSGTKEEQRGEPTGMPDPAGGPGPSDSIPPPQAAPNRSPARVVQWIDMEVGGTNPFQAQVSVQLAYLSSSPISRKGKRPASRLTVGSVAISRLTELMKDPDTKRNEQCFEVCQRPGQDPFATRTYYGTPEDCPVQSCPPGTLRRATCHVHPWIGGYPGNSGPDVAVCKQLGVPSYVGQGGNVWVYDPSTRQEIQVCCTK